MERACLESPKHPNRTGGMMVAIKNTRSMPDMCAANMDDRGLSRSKWIWQLDPALRRWMVEGGWKKNGEMEEISSS